MSDAIFEDVNNVASLEGDSDEHKKIEDQKGGCKDQVSELLPYKKHDQHGSKKRKRYKRNDHCALDKCGRHGVNRDHPPEVVRFGFSGFDIS